MKESRKTKHKKRYSKISTQKRLKLVQMVLEEGLTLTKVAKLLRIKRPTAKIIVKRYKQNGTIFYKKTTQLKTKQSIGSQNSIKVQQNSEENVSISLDPEINQQGMNEGELRVSKVEQQQVNQNMGYVYYFPPFSQYHVFM